VKILKGCSEGQRISVVQGTESGLSEGCFGEGIMKMYQGCSRWSRPMVAVCCTDRNSL